MIRSMTGFGLGEGRVGGDSLTVEIRTVNGRFCEVRPRLPRELAPLEHLLVRMIKERLSRGNVDVTVKRGREGAATLVPRIDEGLAERLTASLRALRDKLELEGDLSLSDLLTLDGVVTMEEPEVDREEVAPILLAATEQALDGVLEMREREGQLLLSDIEGRLASIESHRVRLADLARREEPTRRERYQARIQELLEDGQVDPQRLAQEAAILAERADVSEELTRLASHLEHFEGLLEGDEPAGRRMDFLVQEMNREVNTIASKASWLESAEIVVEMKAEIERLREQIQNIE